MNNIYEAWAQRKTLLEKINTVESELITNPQAMNLLHREPNTSTPPPNTYKTTLSSGKHLSQAVSTPSPSTLSTTTSSVTSMNGSTTNWPGTTSIRGAATPKTGEQYGTSGLKLLSDMLDGTLPQVPGNSMAVTYQTSNGSPTLSCASNGVGYGGYNSKMVDNPPKPYRTSSPFSISSLVSNSDDSRRSASPASRNSPLVGCSSTMYTPLYNITIYI